MAGMAKHLINNNKVQDGKLKINNSLRASQEPEKNEENWVTEIFRSIKEYNKEMMALVSPLLILLQVELMYMLLIGHPAIIWLTAIDSTEIMPQWRRLKGKQLIRRNKTSEPLSQAKDQGLAQLVPNYLAVAQAPLGHLWEEAIKGRTALVIRKTCNNRTTCKTMTMAILGQIPTSPKV